MERGKNTDDFLDVSQTLRNDSLRVYKDPFCVPEVKDAAPAPQFPCHMDRGARFEQEAGSLLNSQLRFCCQGTPPLFPRDGSKNSQGISARNLPRLPRKEQMRSERANISQLQSLRLAQK